MFIINKKRDGKLISESAIEEEKIELFSEHIDPLGVIYGGRMLETVASYAQRVAEKHSEAICKRSSVDFIRIFAPAKKGDILMCSASINKAWRASMEVGVKVMAEDLRSLSRKEILSAYFTFDAVDENNNLKEISEAICETKDQKRRFIAAEKRRKLRIEKRLKIMDL